MAQLDRRALIGGVLTAAVQPWQALAAPAPNLRFNILRNGKPFGQYTVASVVSGDAVTVTSDVTMKMRVSGLTVFDYMLHCVETWRGGRFMELKSNSRRDNQNNAVSVKRGDAGAITANNTSGLVALPANASPLSHWNPAAFDGPLFNPQDGYPLRLTAQSMGREGLTLANGTKIGAVHWALRGESQIDDWYDDAGVWAGLRAVFPDKSIVEYRRL